MLVSEKMRKVARFTGIGLILVLIVVAAVMIFAKERDLLPAENTHEAPPSTETAATESTPDDAVEADSLPEPDPRHEERRQDWTYVDPRHVAADFVLAVHNVDYVESTSQEYTETLNKFFYPANSMVGDGVATDRLRTATLRDFTMLGYGWSGTSISDEFEWFTSESTVLRISDMSPYTVREHSCIAEELLDYAKDSGDTWWWYLVDTQITLDYGLLHEQTSDFSTKQLEFVVSVHCEDECKVLWAGENSCTL